MRQSRDGLWYACMVPKGAGSPRLQPVRRLVRPQHPADRTSGDQEGQRVVASSPRGGALHLEVFLWPGDQAGSALGLVRVAAPGRPTPGPQRLVPNDADLVAACFGRSAPSADTDRARGPRSKRSPRQLAPARSGAWCSASIWSAPDGTGLLTLDASSVQTAPDGCRRTVWMIKR